MNPYLLLSTAADGPVEAGIAAAVDEAVQLVGLPGVAGVTLSGLECAGVQIAAEIQAEIGRRFRAARGDQR